MEDKYLFKGFWIFIIIFIGGVIYLLDYGDRYDKKIAKKIALAHPELYPELDLDERITVIKRSLVERRNNNDYIPIYIPINKD